MNACRVGPGWSVAHPGPRFSARRAASRAKAAVVVRAGGRVDGSMPVFLGAARCAPGGAEGERFAEMDRSPRQMPHHAAVCLAVFVSVAGCATAAPPAPAPAAQTASASPPAWDGSGDFRLVFTDFHFEIGQQIVIVASDGAVTDLFVTHELLETQVFCKAPANDDDAKLCETVTKEGLKQFGRSVPHVARYTLSPDALRRGRELLVAAKFDGLAPRYENSSIADGTTHTYRLTAGGQSRTVSAYGVRDASEPPALQAVLRWLRGERDAHAKARADAPRITGAERVRIEQDALGK